MLLDRLRLGDTKKSHGCTVAAVVKTAVVQEIVVGEDLGAEPTWLWWEH